MTNKEEGTIHTLKTMTIVCIVAATTYYIIFNVLKEDIRYFINSLM